MITDFELAMARELEALALQRPTIEITIATQDALTLIAALQLLLRHRGLEGHTREVPTRIKNALAAVLSGSPALAAAIRMGEDPTLDRWSGRQ